MEVYTVYKTTNIINGKIYIGVHKTSNIDDGYLGSGSNLKPDIIKYGKENFKKEILFVFSSAEEAFKKEKELVNVQFILDENTYNIYPGGAGFDLALYNLNVPERKAKNRRAAAAMRESPILQTPEYKEKMKEVYKNIGEKNRQAHKDGSRKVSEEFKMAFKGKKHSQKILEKMSEFQKINQAGEKNSQFGTRWCNDGVNNIKIAKGEEIPEGYHLGKVKLTKEQRKPRKSRKKQESEKNYDFGQAKRKFSDQQIAQSLIDNNHDVPKAMKELGYKHLNGSSWRRFIKILNQLNNQ